MKLAKPRKRVCLQDGLILDLNRLSRNGLIQRGAHTGARGIRWMHPYLGEIASGTISADMSGREGRLRVQIGDWSQKIVLIARARHFGGRWYFVRPVSNRLASVIWKPDGAVGFCSRHAWPGTVIYRSQCGSWIDRAHLGKAKIAERFGGNWDSAKRTLPPRPKGMRTRTYERLVNKFGAYQAALDHGMEALASRSYSNQ